MEYRVYSSTTIKRVTVLHLTRWYWAEMRVSISSIWEAVLGRIVIRSKPAESREGGDPSPALHWTASEVSSTVRISPLSLVDEQSPERTATGWTTRPLPKCSTDCTKLQGNGDPLPSLHWTTSEVSSMDRISPLSLVDEQSPERTDRLDNRATSQVIHTLYRITTALHLKCHLRIGYHHYLL